VLSMKKESGRAPESKQRAKREISSLRRCSSLARLSARLAPSPNPLTRAKHNGGAKHDIAILEPI